MTKQLSDIEFENLIYKNQALIIKVCKFYCRSHEDINDLFQEITINLWKGISSFEGNSKLSTWIYRVSLNTAISKSIKNSKTRIVYTEKVPEPDGYYHDEGPYDEQQIKALYAGIDKLKPLEKAVILLYLEEKSYKEISEITGISEKNVSVKLVRIRRQLEIVVNELINKIN